METPKVEDLIKRLGRIPITDERDKNFKMKAVLPKTSTRKFRYWWSNGWWGDQGNTPECVAYAWLHYLADGPVTQDKNLPLPKPFWLYKEAQRNDQWPGENYEGTSVRAGAKILQREGYIQEYRWTWSVEEMALAILTHGPVGLGVNWYFDMFYPEPKTNIIKIGKSRNAGGHMVIANGVNTEKEIFRIKNSWGREWGNKGHAYISFEDMQRLLNEQGEAAIAIEVRKLAK